MTLPCSGTISMSQVNTELGLPSTTPISLNDAAVRSLAVKPVPGSTIRMSDLHCKSAPGSTPPTPPSATIEVWDSTPGLDTNSWANDNNITFVNDATLALSNIDNPNSGNKKQTTYLVGRTLGLGVPAGKILTDLKFEYRIQAVHTGDPAGTVQVYRLSLFNNTTKIGVVKTPGNNIAGAPLTTFSLNGNSAYWGVTLTSALVNSSLFGGGLVVRNYSGKGNYTVQYAWMRITATW